MPTSLAVTLCTTPQKQTKNCWPHVFFILNNKIYFLYHRNSATVRQGETERYRQILSTGSLLHGHSSCSWARPMKVPETPSSSPMWVASTWTIICRLSWFINTELDHKCSIWDSDMGCWYSRQWLNPLHHLTFKFLIWADSSMLKFIFKEAPEGNITHSET